MALKIGQKRNIDNESSNNYMNNISQNFSVATAKSLNPFIDEYANNNDETQYFSDYCLHLNENTLNIGTVYYLVLKIKKPIQHKNVEDNLYYLDGSSGGSGHSYDDISFSIILQQDDYYEDADDNYPIQKINIQSYQLGKIPQGLENTDNAYFYLDVVFTPVINIYNNIVLRLNRNYYDAIKEERKYFSDGGTTGGSSPVEFQIYTLTNLMGSKESYWTKMGIQTRPGTLIIINKEPIRVGRSGIYELNNGTRITSFMMAAPPNMDESAETTPEINPYLLDYIYQEGNQQ